MKALVTGATGFIGFNLCRELSRRDFAVTALVLPGEDVTHIEDNVVRILYGDLTDPPSLEGISEDVDIVFHLAAKVTDWGPPKAFYATILDGTRNLLEECSGKVSRFLYVSSMAACGLGRHLNGLTEEAVAMKSGVPYNDAKLDAERLVKSYQGKVSTRFAIVRPANVIGPGSVWVKDIIARYRGLFVPLIDAGKHSASLIYIDNLVDGIIRAGTADTAEGKTYFLRDDWSVTWKQYVTDLGSIVGKKPFGSIPFKAAWTMGSILEKILTPLHIRPPVTRLAAGVMGRDNDVDTSLAQKELGWKTNVSYEEAMEKIRQWVLETMV
ncbi:MAG: NAD-dependent epimerase/dehydratase family protein [Syntrophobacterales bacterium]|nr:MAG: NAD-dependent epimerase/dehydratase family protein [Syntrophobacterales bacterium]